LLYLSMEYVPGADLQDLIDGTPLPLTRVLDLAIQIAGALEAAHRAGIVHRDLKPTNVLVTPDGQVKVVDFGLARVLEPPPSAPDGGTQPVGLSSTGRVMGTAAYMAPEQAHGTDVDERSDLFSLGVILYRLVTGHLPFTGKTVLEIFYAAANVEPPPLARYASNVPDELERIVRKLLAKDPGRRYQSAHEVKTDLEHLRHHLHDEIHPHKFPVRPVAVVAGVVLIVLLALLVWQRMASGGGQSLAIMPFQNKTNDPGLNYLGEGIASQIIAKLVSQSRLNVANLESTTRLARTNATTSAVARELGVQAVLEGSIHQDTQGTALDVALVDGRRGYVRWTGHYDYSLSNLLDIEHDIANQVSIHLSGGPAGPPPAKAPPHTMTAYALSLRASASLEDPGDPQGADRAAELYQQAIDRDADFAIAWAGRSRALWKVWSRDKDPAVLRQAEEAADHAVRLDPQLLEAHVARAQIYRATSRYTESAHELEGVLAVNPNWDDALLQLAATQRESGNLATAEVTVRRAVAIRPTYWRNWNSLAGLLWRRGNYAEAKDAYLQVARLLPDKNVGYAGAAAMEISRGDYAAALASFQKLPEPVETADLASNVGTAYFFLRQLPEAKRYYQLAVSLEPHDPTLWINLGDLYARAGSPDSARVAYQEALRLNEAVLHVDPSSAAERRVHAVVLAKLGDCATAVKELVSLPPVGKDAEGVHVIARIAALCGDRERALATVRLAIQLGVPPSTVREEDEFRGRAQDPEFLALTKPTP